MGAISPLNQTSQSFEFVQDLTGFDKSEEYSLFTEYLSPLSDKPEPELAPNAYYQERYDEATPVNTPKDRQHESGINEQHKDQKGKSVSEAPSTSKSKAKDPLASNQKISQKGEAQPASAKNNIPTQSANLSAVISLSSAESQGTTLNGMSVLKENVKNILNNLKQVSKRDTTALIKPKTQPPSGKIAFFKISTETPKTTQKLNFQQTTVAHLASRNKHEVISNENKTSQQTEGPQTNKHSLFLKPSKNHPMHLISKEIKDQSIEQLKGKKSRTKTQKGAAPNKSGQSNNQQNLNHDPNTTGSIVREQIHSSHSIIDSSQEHKGIKQSVSDGASNDAEFKNLLSKGQRNTDSIRGKRFKAQSTSRAHRALNWLKTLSERTALLDKTNPQWKVMEMQLEKGNGKMTVKVMKEGDQVSVAVNFSDPEVRAMAEAEYTTILKDLQEQYQQEVRFTFSDQEQTPFESFNSQKTLSHKINPNLSSKGQHVKEQNVPAEFHDQKGWIG